MPKEKAGNNAALIEAFDLLKRYELKGGNAWAGKAYAKVVDVLAAHKGKITSSKDVASKAGIGKASVGKIDEFLTTGTIEKLDEFKTDMGELPAMVGVATASGKKTAGGKKAASSKKGRPPTKAQLKAIKEAEEAFQGQTNDQMKQKLRELRQRVTGTKAELAARLAECKVIGVPPVCPECGGGKLRFDRKTGVYSCPGYQDDDEFKPCFFKSTEVTLGSFE